jgi:NitT/TauT family transport system ATP-binding protein
VLTRIRQRLEAVAQRPRLLRVSRLLVPSRVREGRAKLTLRGVGHTFGHEVVALRDVDIDVHTGEFVCLLGPSGCGKSTLLYALAGLVKPSGGRVSLDGRDVTGPGPERMLMFQDPALFPWLTVRQNITFVLRARGLSRRDAEERARAFVKLVQLEGF